jgi:hypothetical protein
MNAIGHIGMTSGQPESPLGMRNHQRLQGASVLAVSQAQRQSARSVDIRQTSIPPRPTPALNLPGAARYTIQDVGARPANPIRAARLSSPRALLLRSRRTQ